MQRSGIRDAAMSEEDAADRAADDVQPVQPEAPDGPGSRESDESVPLTQAPAVPRLSLPEHSYRPPALALATAPAMRPWRGGALAGLLHFLLLGAALVLIKPHLPPPAPDGQAISVVMETAPAPQAAVAPAVPARKPAPPATPAALPLPQSKAGDMPLPTAPAAPPSPALAKPVPAPAPVAAAAQKTAAKTPPPMPGPHASVSHIGVSRPAQVLSETTLLYAMYSKDAAPQGSVELSVQVMADGTPGQVTIIRSSGSAMLDNVARNNVLTWRFKPALKNGAPVASVLTRIVTFMAPPAGKPNP